MAISQQQIADKLNVSIATVSRSLKNDQAISPQTRALVLKTASQMGYEVLSARPRRTVIDAEPECFPICAMIQTDSRSGAILVSGYLTGMSEAVCYCNSSLIVHYVPLKNRERAADPALLPTPLRNGNVNGVVLIHHYPQEVVAQFIRQYPCVSMGYDYYLPHLDVVDVNNVAMIRTMVERLYLHGHRQIAYVGEPASYSWARARFAGYIDGITSIGIGYLPENVIDFSQHEFDASVAGRVARRIREGVTGIVCACDDIAYRLMAMLRSLGIEVPRDVSVTGVDADPVPSGLVKLQSARFPGEYMGATAVSALIERKRHPAAPARQLLLEATIIDGESIADVNI